MSPFSVAIGKAEVMLSIIVKIILCLKVVRILKLVIFSNAFAAPRVVRALQSGTTDIQSCPIKLPPLFRAPAVWVVPFDLYVVWRGSEAIYMRFLSKYYNNNTSNTFNYLFLLLLISFETTTPHVRRCPFIFAVLYTQVPTVAPPTDDRVVYMISHFMTRCIS